MDNLTKKKLKKLILGIVKEYLDQSDIQKECSDMGDCGINRGDNSNKARWDDMPGNTIRVNPLEEVTGEIDRGQHNRNIHEFENILKKHGWQTASNEDVYDLAMKNAAGSSFEFIVGRSKLNQTRVAYKYPVDHKNSAYFGENGVLTYKKMNNIIQNAGPEAFAKEYTNWGAKAAVAISNKTPLNENLHAQGNVGAMVQDIFDAYWQGKQPITVKINRMSRGILSNMNNVTVDYEIKDSGLSEATVGQSQEQPVPDKNGNVTVIQVDQWTSSGNVEKIPFDKLSLNAITGGDSKAAKAIFGGHFKIKVVPFNSSPTTGYVWLIKSKNGYPVKWKYNYDTSD
jgi:hypothetical protein